VSFSKKYSQKAYEVINRAIIVIQPQVINHGVRLTLANYLQFNDTALL